MTRYSGNDSKMPSVLLAVMPVTARAGATMTVTRSPARALNPSVPMMAANRLLAVFLGAGIGYRVRHPRPIQAEWMPHSAQRRAHRCAHLGVPHHSADDPQHRRDPQ